MNRGDEVQLTALASDRAIESGQTDAQATDTGVVGVARLPACRRYAAGQTPSGAAGQTGQGGKQLLLVTVRIGGEILTTAEWVDAFERERQRLGQRVAPLVPLPRSERARTKAHKAAEARLDRAGIRRTDG